ncbi:hypothetical protein Dsin_001375 [Dipteronia sinensis]|uniref:Tafazzin family protein n=1 Tax=Dipteronia sinensis TaxID=43782 RepID=A0AAE0EIN9_9ROSI|nr:hypothetical protein Dsin_001375 [Dipteronia sinensis]
MSALDGLGLCQFWPDWPVDYGQICRPIIRRIEPSRQPRRNSDTFSDRQRPSSPLQPAVQPLVAAAGIRHHRRNSQLATFTSIIDSSWQNWKMEWAGREKHMGGIPRKLVIMAVGTFAKAVATLLNTTSVHNADTLIHLVRSRPPGVPLITVSNHMSTSVIGLSLSFFLLCKHYDCVCLFHSYSYYFI